ncbi:MAG: glycoside hydrolase family 99-like domain-containing protein [Pirellulales bacterium]
MNRLLSSLGWVLAAWLACDAATVLGEDAAAKLYVPAPQPVKSDYLVGAYYFPGWKPGVHTGWTAIRDFPERKPLLGWYHEGDPDIADWHIKWAVEHGISFFAYDWYWDRGQRQLEHALDGYFKSRYRKSLQFCLLWANHNPPKSTSEEDLAAVTRFWIDHYFRQPEYLRIDNKPVVIIFTPNRITEDLGVAKTKAAFQTMRRICREAGFDGLFLVGCAWPSREMLAAMQAEGYDAATGYNYPAAGAKPQDGKRPTYDSAIDGYRNFWETIEGYKLVDYFPVTDPGWDSRPWQGNEALVRTGRHPAKFKKMLELAKTFADAHPVGKEHRKIVLAEAWNEFGEGAAIEPHREFGFGYLDAIREVFTNAPANHKDLTPEDVGLPVRQWKSVSPQTAWEFDAEDDSEGWNAMMGTADFEVRGGVLKTRSLTGDPAMTCAVRFDAAKFRGAVIRLKVDKGTLAQLFWTTTDAGESEANSLQFKTIADGQFHEYRLDLGKVPTWRGTVKRLRFDPSIQPGTRIELDYFRMLENP